MSKEALAHILFLVGHQMCLVAWLCILALPIGVCVTGDESFVHRWLAFTGVWVFVAAGMKLVALRLGR